MTNVTNKNRKVVLFQPAYWEVQKGAQRAPLGLLAISSLLDREGYPISIVSETLYDHPEKKVLEDCQDAICFGITSLTGYQIAGGLHMAKLVRAAYPDLPIVWGGWHPTLEPDTTIASPYVDIVVRGQGERAFTELVHALEENKSLKGILGVSYKENGQPVHNDQRPLEDINNFPPIPYHLVNVERTLSNDEFGDRVISYISSYGCHYQCTFCAEWGYHGKKWSGLTAQRVADDFERFVKDYGVDCICLNDMQFFLDKNRVIELCEELLKRDLNVKWDNVSGNIRPLLEWEDEMWDLMYRAGCRSIPVGAESGYQPALDMMKKPLTVEETVRFAEKSKKHGIRITFSTMVGLPWDTDYEKTRRLVDEEIRLTLELARKIISISDKHRVCIYIYTPYPGTPLWEKSLELGLIAPRTLEGWSEWVINKITTPWILPEQAKFTQFVSEYLFFFHDPLAYSWVTARVPNPVARLILKAFYKVYIRIAKFRWKHQFYNYRFDYRLYMWGRKILHIG